jgi:hypothetical protein
MEEANQSLGQGYYVHPIPNRGLPPRTEVGTPPAEEGDEGGEPRAACRAP